MTKKNDVIEEMDLVDIDPVYIEFNIHSLSHTWDVIYDDDCELGYSIRMTVNFKNDLLENPINCLKHFDLDVGLLANNNYYIDINGFNTSIKTSLSDGYSKDQLNDVLDLFIDLYRDYDDVVNRFNHYKELLNKNLLDVR